MQAAGGVRGEFQLEDFSLEPQAPRFLLRTRGAAWRNWTAVLQCAYGARIMTVGVTAAAEGVWLPDPGGANALFHARSAPPKGRRWPDCSAADSPDRAPTGGMRLNGQNAVLNFFAREFAKIAAGVERGPGGTVAAERGAEY